MGRHTEGQDMLALGGLMNKPKGGKDEIKQFRAKVARDQKEMTTLLQQRLQQAQEEDTRRRNAFASLISDTLQPPVNHARPAIPAFANTNIGTNPPFGTARKVNTACKKLVSEYNAFEAMIADMAGNEEIKVSEQWAQDVVDTEWRLRLGHKVAIRNVKKVLGAHNGDNSGRAEDEEMDVEQMATEELNYELLQGLRYAERGVKRMVKGLPKGD